MLCSDIKYCCLIKTDWKHILESPNSFIGSSGYQTISLMLAQLIYAYFSLSEFKSVQRTLLLNLFSSTALFFPNKEALTTVCAC